MRRIAKFTRKKRLIPFLGKFSPERKFYRIFWQKPRGGNGSYFHEFDPKKFGGDKEKTFQYAKQYKKFFQDLIKEGVYPEGTKVKVKRKRHSNRYLLEFWMPEVAYWHKDTTSKKDNERFDNQMEEMRIKMEEIAKKHGYTSEQILMEDPYRYNNYGRNQNNNLKYLDTEILFGHLPFKEKKTSLSKKLITSFSLGSFILSLFFLSPNITGNIIGNLNKMSTNSFGALFFLASLISGIIALRKS